MYLQNGRAEHIRIWARLQSYTIDCSCVLQQTLAIPYLLLLSWVRIKHGCL